MEDKVQYLLKKDLKLQLASGKTLSAISASQSAPSTLRTGRGILVSTNNLVAIPSGALVKFKGEVIVFKSMQTPAEPGESIRK